MAVVEHGAVDDTLRVLCKLFQVLVVCGYDTECLFPIETVEKYFCDGSADLRFGTSAEFIDEQERTFIAVLDEKLHVRQVGTVSTEVVLYRLFVAYIDEDVVEDSCMGIFVYRYEQSALQHILQ